MKLNPSFSTPDLGYCVDHDGAARRFRGVLPKSSEALHGGRRSALTGAVVISSLAFALPVDIAGFDPETSFEQVFRP